MRKITIIEHISLDGVIQAPGGPGEDGDYPYGGWAAPHADPAVGEAIVAAHGDNAPDCQYAVAAQTLRLENLIEGWSPVAEIPELRA
jgi:hypothetical protein